MNQPGENTTYQDINQATATCHLEIFGAFHPVAADHAPDGTGTLLLLGPKEPGFWDHLRQEPEFRDKSKDPIDRWSSRVIGQLAVTHSGTALFPFGGPPYLPFIAWAIRSGRAWASPVTLLVHDRAGLLASYRGAIALPCRINLPGPAACPCDTCIDQPCKTACPVDALNGQGYDLNACHNFLDTADGATCMDNGCAVRRACPVSQSYGRNPAQSAHHMKVFHP